MIVIHAGKYKSKRIDRVKVKSTKETASMVREAVFNSLFKVHGKVLDLFAGSGSYGITALSLGASEAYFIENNSKAISTINSNLNKLNIKAKVYKTDYNMFLKRNKVKFDYIFLDPPYDFKSYELLLNNIKPHLNDNSYIILEVDRKSKIDITNNSYEVIKDKNYGSKRIIIFFFKLS